MDKKKVFNKNKSSKETAGGAKKASNGAVVGVKKNKAKDITTVMNKKPVRKIVEYYYFVDKEVGARDLQHAVGAEMAEKADIWPELNLMEVEMNFDSLIFQDATECFIDPADLAWFEEQGIQAKYQISYDTGDIELVRKVMKNIMETVGGRICSDTDDFEPSYSADALDKLL